MLHHTVDILKIPHMAKLIYLVMADGLNLQLFLYGLQIVQRGSQSGQAAQVRLFMAVLGGDTAELQRHFTLKLSGSAGSWQLLLLPKTVVMKQVFENITISGDKLVRRIELKEKQGDRTVMQFEQLQTDQALDAAAKQALE